jgi:hypothetical protein
LAPREYRSPDAFRSALEQRIRTVAPGAGINRFRQRLVFDRFLARVFHHFGDQAILKGGLVLELRLERARTTKDVDLRLIGDGRGVVGSLRLCGSLDLGDWLSFIVEPDVDMPRITGEGMVYDGFRFRVEARLGGKLFGDPFGVDIGFADALTAEPDITEGSRFLEFAGITPPKFRLYLRNAHIAEKVHAYTVPRGRSNTRVKDLPDIALLASIGSLNAVELREAIEATFSFRSTHPVPASLPPPPSDWVPVYGRMARNDELPWKTLADVHQASGLFLDPILRRGAIGTWDPTRWVWH